MRTFYKPDIETILKPLLQEATQNGLTSSEWLSMAVPTLAVMLRENPRIYRSYGPFWWLLKRAFIDRGIFEFGETIDLEWYEYAAYGDEVLNLLACFAYNEYAINAGLAYSHTHLVAFTNEDGEVEEDQYVLFDDDMESQIKL